MPEDTPNKYLSSTARAISGKRNLFLPQTIASAGDSDTEAFKHLYHNPALHHTIRPADGAMGHIFDLAELARIKSLGAKRMLGVAANLLHDFDCNQATDLATELHYYLFEVLSGYQILGCNFALPQNITPYHQDLIDHLANQAKFGDIILHILTLWHPESQQTKPIASAEEQAAQPDSTISSLNKTQESTEGSKQIPQEHKQKQGRSTHQSSGDEVLWPIHSYKPYTTEFDEIITAKTLSSKDELTSLRKRLDLKLSSLKKASNAKVQKLQRKLLSKHFCSWDVDLEDGILDQKKFSQLIASPSYRSLYQQKKEQRQLDTVVSLLIDNSGSMRGKPIAVAAMSADILAQVLEKCSVKTEILGFTTVEWKGGKSWQLWQNNGASAFPGRLNDLRYIIYKSADMPLKKAKNNLGACLKEGLLKENIDGEALAWAYQRLLKRPEKRRILLVISDGAPIDDMTISANGKSYLEDHLKSVISDIETSKAIELIAIGIGHDVTKYYQTAVNIDDIDNLCDTLLDQISNLLS